MVAILVVMLFQLWAGLLPFHGESLAALMYQISDRDAPDVRVIRPEVPDLLADILVRCLAKSADPRQVQTVASCSVAGGSGPSRGVSGGSEAGMFESTQISPPKQQEIQSATVVVAASVTNVADQNDDGFDIQL